MTTIYLIRHAEAEGNLYRLAHGQYNSTLTPRGYRQLSVLRRRFQDVTIDAVYGSDLFRTYATASAIFVPRGLTYHPVPLLREVSIGPWEGLSWAEIQRLDEENLINFNKRLDRWKVKGAETFDIVRDRMVEGIRQVVRECPDQTVAVTSHGAAMRVLLGTLQGLELKDIGNTVHCDNTAVSKLEAEGDQIRVVYRDDDSHLPDELSSFRRQTWHKDQRTMEPGLWYRVTREDDAGRVQTAMLEEAAVGRIGMVLTPNALKVTDYRMDPAHRGRHFGTQLMGQAIQYARAHGRDRVILTCQPELEGFFTQFGFTVTARWEAETDMALDISLTLREIP